MAAPWPPVPDGFQNDVAMLKYRAEKIVDAEVGLEKELRAAKPPTSPTVTMSFALEQKLHETLFTVATGAVERARSGAQFVQTAASAIGVLYTGVLAVIFVSETPVPARGFLPTLFFAIAIGLATAYLAFVNKMAPIDRPTLWGSVPEDIWQRTNFLARYTRAIVLHRAPLLRAAVVSLAFGVFLLPAAVFRIPQANVTPPPEPNIVWPEAPAEERVELAAILYQAQVDRFVEELGEPPATSGLANEDVLAALVAILGLAFVIFTATNRMWGDETTDPDGAVVVPPTIQPEDQPAAGA